MYLDKNLRTAISEEAVSKWLVSCEFRTFHVGMRLQEVMHKVFHGSHGRLTNRRATLRSNAAFDNYEHAKDAEGEQKLVGCAQPIQLGTGLSTRASYEA